MNINIFWKCSIQVDPTLLCLETYPVPALSALLATYTSVVWYTASE